MVCVPCVLVPVLLFLWKLIQPFVWRFWNPWKGVKAEENAAITDQGCPLGCPMKPKTKPESSGNKTEVDKSHEGDKIEKPLVNNRIQPFVWRFWNPWKGVKAEENEAITEDQECPLGCLMKPKTKPESTGNKTEVDKCHEGDKIEKPLVNNKTEETAEKEEDKKEK